MTSTDWHENLETNLERSLGTGDLRMLYGVGVPFITMTFLIIAALVLEAVWLTAVLMVLIAAFTVVVLIGLNHMLDDEDDSRVPR
ncbi:MAG TPA: hypothetical protein VF587_20475 [Solirubrobacteraceae bacterium]|jgi:hypothetical protein